MPRRKRNASQNEGRKKVRRTDPDDEDTLVISDSENEEEEDTVNTRSSREVRWRERENRTQMQEMTEEEMLDLAMRLSKQEASSAAHRRQLEDDDMRKAIAESLHVSHSQGSDVSLDTASCLAKPNQIPATVTPHSRRKLSFPSKSETTMASVSDVIAAAESGTDGMQDISSLPPMPDLSQRTHSQPSPPSSGMPPVPSAASEESCSTQRKDQKEQVLNVDSLGDEPSDWDSQCSGRPWQCNIRLGQDLMSISGALRNPLSTQDGSLSLTCPSRSQLTQQKSPSPPKSPVFARRDLKGSTELLDDKVVCCTSKDKISDIERTSKEEDGKIVKDPSSHKKQPQQSRDPRKRFSLYRTSQSSLHISVPDDADPEQEAVEPKKLKDESIERVPNSEEMPSLADKKSLEDFTSHMVLHLSDDDDDDDEEEEKVIDPSPVFHQEFVPHSDHPKLSPTQPCCSPSITTITTQDSSTHPTQVFDSQHACVKRTFTSRTAHSTQSDQIIVVPDKPSLDSRPIHPVKEKEYGSVSYYWGVPFCPRGQSPDDYTRVILSQMEVYEKSLKEAQHQLLRKAEWGVPLFPCPTERPFGRRMKRHRAPQLMEEEEEEEPENETEEKNKVVLKKDEGNAESRAGTEERAKNGQHETYVVVSSPETQEQKSSLLSGQHESTNAVKSPSCRKSSPHDASEDTQISKPDEHEDIQSENYDVENTVCPETQISEDNTPELMVTSPAQAQSRPESEVMEVDEEEAAENEKMEQEQAEEEQQMGSVLPPIQRLECPMCSRLFPISKIEVHAAYCNGTTEELEQQEDLSQVVALRKRNRRLAVEETMPSLEKSEQPEKCFVCQKFFPSKTYSHHVDKCLQKQPKSNQGNGLLSALHQAEEVDLDDEYDRAGPSDVTIKNNSGLVDSSAEGGGDRVCPTSGLYISSSPIKSFTPISEATDCLIDFQQQYSSRPNQRLGRKRKFKR